MRYAIYFSPSADHELTRAASAWLGRDAFTGALPAPVASDGLDAGALAALTEEPRRYGFHATLKAPFSLAEGQSEDALLSAFAAFCDFEPAFAIPAVEIGQIGPFFALVPAVPFQPLQDFAARVVEHFEPFRAGLSPADIARRRPESLSDSQRGNLERWGYPHVMDDFRFHMTLTGPVAPENTETVRAALAARFADFTRVPLAIDGLALFIEPERGAPFTVHSRLALSGAAKSGDNHE